MDERKIIHVDMDCFYAAVECKHRPELRGKAIAIGGPPNTRSVICTASYEARKFKVRSAMPSSQAVRLCPHLILIPPHFDLYKKESRAVREIFHRFTNKVEPLSLDEAYLDVTASEHCQGSATLIAQEIRRLILKETGLTASAGIAPNKFLAKVASDWKKPNGQFTIRPADVAAFVQDLKVEQIYGVGKVTAAKMHKLGLHTCKDLQQVPAYRLREWFGSWGPHLAELAHGVDHRPVEPRSERKSLSVEETYNKDLPTLQNCLEQLPTLYVDWQERMQRAGLASRIRGHVVKMKYFDFQGTTRESSSRAWPSIKDFENLLRQSWEKRPEPVRLLGVGVRLAGSDAGKSDSDKDASQLAFGI